MTIGFFQRGPSFARALRSRNYRLYFFGQLVSLAGTWMQQIAMIWLAYRLSNSAFVLGTIGFASQIPILIFASIGGVWTDRLDRRRLLMWTQALSMLQAIVLAALACKEWVSPGLLMGLALFLGCINALSYLAVLIALGAIRITVLPNRSMPTLEALQQGLGRLRGNHAGRWNDVSPSGHPGKPQDAPILTLAETSP